MQEGEKKNESRRCKRVKRRKRWQKSEKKKESDWCKRVRRRKRVRGARG